ncbi:MAG: type II toxin-antitoxin system RelE/ParE family toxin [Microbacteriaceae bacterium]|nr:type II toxin-antitoxin system RelE/ParE family toxin [Microbacteriaceae bacterium]
MWRVELSPRAERAFRKLDRKLAIRVRDSLARLATLEDPARSCKALTGPLAGFWRFRVGDLRVILDFDIGKLVILAIDIGQRDSVYRQRSDHIDGDYRDLVSERKVSHPGTGLTTVVISGDGRMPTY